MFLWSRLRYHESLFNNHVKTFTWIAQENHEYECFHCQKKSLSSFYKSDLNDFEADVEINVNFRQFKRAL